MLQSDSSAPGISVTWAAPVVNLGCPRWLSMLQVFERSSWAATAHLASATREGDFVVVVDHEPPLSGARQRSAFEQQCREQEGRATWI